MSVHLSRRRAGFIRPQSTDSKKRNPRTYAIIASRTKYLTGSEDEVIFASRSYTELRSANGHVRVEVHFPRPKTRDERRQRWE